MIGRNPTRIELKLDDDLHELDSEHMQKLRQAQRLKAQERQAMLQQIGTEGNGQFMGAG